MFQGLKSATNLARAKKVLKPAASARLISNHRYSVATSVRASRSAAPSFKFQQSVAVYTRDMSTESSKTAQTMEFQAETGKLLDTVTPKSIHTDKEVFISELVSNASDALEKFRYKQSAGDMTSAESDPLEININTDSKRKTLTIVDNGFAMNREELIANLGTIARSGSKAFVENLKDGSASESKSTTDGIIGQFGVGFYSFMVSDEVEVASLSASDASVTVLKWQSDGSGQLTVDSLPAVGVSEHLVAMKRGSRITMKLKPTCENYANADIIKAIIMRNSSYVAFPIKVNGEVVNVVQGAQVWIESVFGRMRPSVALLDRSVRLKSDSDTQCIINEPHITMSNPLLGLNISSLTETVLQTAREEPSGRTKPLLVTVRGMGGGKTRLFEEIRRDLQKNNSVLPLAITFNSKTGFDDVEFAVPSATNTAALSIMARMARAFYGQSFDAVHAHMLATLPRLAGAPKAKGLYVAFVQLMRKQMECAGCPVETFVLLVDETVQIQDKMIKLHRDPLADLRTALLDEMPNAALALSSLDVNVKGVISSGRSLRPLLQCEVLNLHEIVTQWWGITDPELQHRFLLIAAALCDLPRALEIASTYIQVHQAEIRALNFCEELVADLKVKLRERYAGAPRAVPSPPLLRAMIFKSDCKLDANAASAIQSSSLTNVLSEEIQENATEKASSFCPRANLLMLTLRPAKTNTFVHALYALLDSLFATTIEREKINDEGDLLELHTAMMLCARVGVCMHSRATVTAEDLLGLTSTDVASPLSKDIRFNKKMTKLWTGKVQTLQHSSHQKNTESFRKEIEAIQVSAEWPVVLRRSARDDGFDLLMKVFHRTAPGKCQYIFIDSKSLQETDKNARRTCVDLGAQVSPEQFPKKGAQAKKLCTVMSKLAAPTTYVYLTTLFVEQAMYRPLEHPKMLWVYAGREQMQEFMGPLWDLHRAYREGASNPTQPQQL